MSFHEGVERQRGMKKGVRFVGLLLFHLYSMQREALLISLAFFFEPINNISSQANRESFFPSWHTNLCIIEKRLIQLRDV